MKKNISVIISIFQFWIQIQFICIAATGEFRKLYLRISNLQTILRDTQVLRKIIIDVPWIFSNT